MLRLEIGSKFKGWMKWRFVFFNKSICLVLNEDGKQPCSYVNELPVNVNEGQVTDKLI